MLAEQSARSRRPEAAIGGFDTLHGARRPMTGTSTLVAYAEHVADEIDRYR